MAKEIGLDDFLALHILDWINSTDLDLEPTRAVTEDVTIPPSSHRPFLAIQWLL